MDKAEQYRIPTAADLEKVAKLPVLDEQGRSHDFKTLYDKPGRHIVVFIRHFFCGVSHAFFGAVTSAGP